MFLTRVCGKCFFNYFKLPVAQLSQFNLFSYFSCLLCCLVELLEVFIVTVDATVITEIVNPAWKWLESATRLWLVCSGSDQWRPQIAYNNYRFRKIRTNRAFNVCLRTTTCHAFMTIIGLYAINTPNERLVSSHYRRRICKGLATASHVHSSVNPTRLLLVTSQRHCTFRRFVISFAAGQSRQGGEFDRREIWASE